MTTNPSSSSVTSVETNSSTLHETQWPGKLDVSSQGTTRVCDPEMAAESLRSMIQALGSEKMAQIRSVITTSQKQKQPTDAERTVRKRGTPDPLSTDATPISKDINTPETDEVALTICLLESALGSEDMSELRSAMNTVRRNSLHLDVLISSEMTEEQLERSVEIVRTRQEQVLEELFIAIMDLIAEKLGIDPGRMDGKGPRSEAEGMTKRIPKMDESNMLKVPPVDSMGRGPMMKKDKERKPKPKKPFDGYSMIFFPGDRRGNSRVIPVREMPQPKGKDKKKVKAADINATNKKAKVRRGCLGFCFIM